MMAGRPENPEVWEQMDSRQAWRNVDVRGPDGAIRDSDVLREEFRRLAGSHQASVDDRWPAASVTDVIYACRGCWADVCRVLGCTDRMLATWFNRHPQRKDDLWKAKVSELERAEETLVGLLDSDREKTRLDAAKALLDRFGKAFAPRAAQPQCATIVNVQQAAQDGQKAVEVRAIFGLPEAKAREEAAGELDRALDASFEEQAEEPAEG